MTVLLWGRPQTPKTLSEVWVPDCVALDEIELYGELIIAASASERPLTRTEIDTVLGIRRVPQ